MVVMTEARTKNRIKYGRMDFNLTVVPSELWAFLVCTNASTNVMGIIARVLVSFTIVAVSKVLLPWIPSQAVAAAVTEDVSLTAVPAKRPNPSLESPKIPPSVGKISAARILNKKITDIDWAISSSSAWITGAVAAMADPPQIEEPTPIKMDILESIFNALYRTNERIREVAMVERIIGRDCFPVR